MNLLDLMVKIGVDDKASERIKAIAGDVKSKLGSAAKTAGVAVAAGVAAAAAGVATFGKMSLDSYANYEQLAGGVEKLFGDSADMVKQYAQDAYMTAGMSANQYMEQATGFSASLINSLGGDTAEAAHLTDVAMRSMSDNVNVFGSNMTDVQNAFQGFAKQNYTMLDNLKLGYGGTKEEMQRLIQDAAAATDAQEALGLSVDANSMSFDNIVKAIDVVQYKQGIWGTTAKEAATTVEGSINMVKAAWQNWLTELGKDDADIELRTQQLVQSVNTMLFGQDGLGGVIPRIQKIVENVAAALPQMLPQFQEALSSLISAIVPIIVELTPIVVDAGLTLFMAILDGLAQASPQITEGLVQLLFKLGELLVQYAPQMVVAAGMLMLGILNGIANGIAPVMTQINETGEQILEGIGSFFMGMFKAGGELIQNIKDGAKQTASDMASFFGGFIRNGLNAVLGFVGGMLNAGLELWNNLKSGATSIGNTIAGTFASWISSGLSNILGFVGSMWSAGTSLISNLLSGASSIGYSIASTVSGWISSAVSQVYNFGSAFYNAGLSILQGLVNGIWAGFSNAANAVASGLSWIRSYLPFSPAKRGPFSGKGWTLYSGESMMNGLAEGIENTASNAARAMRSATEGVRDAMVGDVEMGMSVSASNSQSGLLAEISGLRQDIRSMQLSLEIDGRAFAQATVGEMDAALNTRIARTVYA